MVIPLHPREHWLPMLSGLPSFVPGSQPTVFVSPHPDDETLAAGGLLASLRQLGHPVMLIAVTDGEHAYTDQAGLAKRRTLEQTLAAERLGIDASKIVRLHLPDSGVAGHEGFLIERLLSYVSSETHLLAPWPYDFHPDHEACGRAAIHVARQVGCRLTFYFFWTWHRGAPALFHGLPIHAFELTEPQSQAKAEALAMHVSQLEHPSGDPILHPVHLWPAQLPFEVYLPG